MKFGYFCNTTNRTKKPYTQILDEARDIAIYCDKNNCLHCAIGNNILQQKQ